METAGLRELRQHASELVRRAEAGETVTVTVSGREVAQLGPIEPNQWRSWPEIVELFGGPADTSWDDDRDRVDQAPHDPFER